MSTAGRIMHTFGETVCSGGKTGNGFLSCLDSDDARIHKLRLPSGTANRSKYRLMTDMLTIAEGDAVTVGGSSYVVLRVVPVRIFGAFSHNECIISPKGGCADA